VTPVEVVAHPAAARPGVSVALVAYFIGLALLAGPWLMQVPLLTPVGALGALLVFDACVLGLARWFFPTRYRFEDEGIRVRFMGMQRFYPYARFRSLERTKRGLYLSPRKDPTRFDRFRGLYVIAGDAATAQMLEGLVQTRISGTLGVH